MKTGGRSLYFRWKLRFYKGHFEHHPVTPGVILTETMAQIGLVCLGIFILDNNFTKNTSIALTSTSMDFIKFI
jgi:3-hydroxyacyl-[acyl-carrier-protein] dehydratase